MLAPAALALFDRMGVPPHNPDRMSEAKQTVGVEQELKQLERRLDELLGANAQLHEENRALRQRQDSMMAERATLLQKNEQVRARVEAMIGRLKAMEHSA
jgi:cell division protein ZapB